MPNTRYRVIRETEPYIYADIQLEFATNDVKHELSIREFKLLLMKAMNQMFGDFGNKTQIDLIKYRKSDFRAFIRTQSKDIVRVRTALMMSQIWNQNVCTFSIHKVCHSLSSLSF